MCYSVSRTMNKMSVIAFAVMAVMAAVFMAAIVVRELDIQMPVLTQTGDSSLSRQSVNWLAAIDFTAALILIWCA